MHYSHSTSGLSTYKLLNVVTLANTYYYWAAYLNQLGLSTSQSPHNYTWYAGTVYKCQRNKCICNWPNDSRSNNDNPYENTTTKTLLPVNIAVKTNPYNLKEMKCQNISQNQGIGDGNSQSFQRWFRRRWYMYGNTF